MAFDAARREPLTHRRYGTITPVPRFFVPPMPLPSEVVVALESFGTPFARCVVRHLAGHSPATSAEIAQALGSHPGTVWNRIKQLERAGIVVADTPPGERSGKQVRYSLVPDRVDALLERLREDLQGR